MRLKELNANEPLTMYRRATITSKLERVVFSRIIVADELLTGYKVYGMGDGRNFNQAYKRNRRDQHLMLREKYKLKSEAESIEANVGVGLCQKGLSHKNPISFKTIMSFSKSS